MGGGLGVGWGGSGELGLGLFFLCFGIVGCAGHAYANQVRMMCVLSVPLLDQVENQAPDIFG